MYGLLVCGAASCCHVLRLLSSLHWKSAYYLGMHLPAMSFTQCIRLLGMHCFAWWSFGDRLKASLSCEQRRTAWRMAQQMGR